jgi:uncharacterized protein YndB with AHSA1/START domain
MGKVGELTAHGEARTLRFERGLAAAPEEVWDALTSPGRLARWLASATLEPRVDGAVELDFGQGGVCRGEVTAWDPPRVLAYGWRLPDGHASRVRWTLEPGEGGSTHLTLVHELLRAEEAGGYGAGWHAHLDRLEAHLRGDELDWGARFSELEPRYAQLASALLTA